MKEYLTENGVQALYNSSNQSAVRLQILYITQWKKVWFIRLMDGKSLSPVIILRMTDPVSVGDVIIIRKGQLQSMSATKAEDLYPMIDSDLSHMVITDYQVVESKTKLGLLYQQPKLKETENSYWNSLYDVKHLLIKNDKLAESFFKEEEKRLNSLRRDCILLRERGNEFFKNNKYNKATLHYNMAKQKDHFDAIVWSNSSQAYYMNNEYEFALRDALVAVKLDPFNIKGYYRAGQALKKCECYLSAVEIIEAGIFICGKCLDFEKILKEIKEAKTTFEKSESKLDQLKKKINGDGLVNGGEPSKKLKSKDISNKKAKEQNSHSHKNLNNKNIQIGPILSFLEGARMLYETGKFQNALEIYGDISSKYNCSDYLSPTEFEVLKYLIAVCKVKSGKGQVEDTINIFLEMAQADSFIFMPAVHYWIAKIYEILSLQEKVVHHASICDYLLGKYSSYSLFWPGTKDPLPETSPDELKIWFNEGSWRPAPLAKCRYNDCLLMQGHPMARTEIYAFDFDFRGYIEVLCEENCSICYHPCCWKALKEEKEDGQLGKKGDKDFLGLECFTPDCSGKISVLNIYDEKSQLKKEIIKEKKDKKSNPPSKQKKKKEKKKEKNEVKSFEEKKSKISECEDFQINCEENTTENVFLNKGKVLTDAIDFEAADYKVLKPNSNGLDDFELPTKKKTKNSKKKKGKTTMQITLNEDIDDRTTHNSYLVRLRELKLHRDAQEMDLSPSGEDSTVGLKFFPEIKFDPNRPFYLPKHLQDNHDLLEKVLHSKMISVVSSDVDPKSINNILEFMYFYLKEQQPMKITDPKLSQWISESFPPNAVTHVNKCGGIQNFLLQSFQFAVVDDVICVRDQVLIAQEQVVKATLEKFTPKYLLSDGHKAQKFQPINDDTKSTSSSNSSYSATLLTSNSVPEPENPPKLSAVVSGATPYKNAAMARVVKPVEANVTPKGTPPKPVQQQLPTPTKKCTTIEVPKRRKLKSMDIDPIEIIGAGEMGQLFSPTKATNSIMTSNERSPIVNIVEEENHSKNVSTNSSVIECSKLNAALSDMSEKAKTLEKELSEKTSELQQVKSERDALSTQNQEINDRFSQIKTKTSVELNSLKKQVTESQEKAKTAESSVEWLKAQRESDVRKLSGEKQRLQEELKTQITKLDSFQIRNDQLNANKLQLEEEIKQKSIQVVQLQEQVMALQESLSNTTDRAKDAEYKYLSMKKELIKNMMEKTKKRLRAEVNKMYELIQDASEDTLPKKSIIQLSISEWEETINKLQSNMHSIEEDGQRFIDCIRSGRPLAALPPGDLQIPSIPDLTVAHLLYILTTANRPFNNAVGSDRIPNCSLNSSHSILNAAPLPDFVGSGFRSAFSSNTSSKSGGLGIGGISFSPGQLPLGPLSNEDRTFNKNCGLTDGSVATSKLLATHVADINNSTSSPNIGIATGSFGQDSSKDAGLIVNQLPWSFTEDRLNPIICGNRALGAQSKDLPLPPPKLGNSDQLPGFSLNVSTPEHPKEPQTSSAFGLQCLVDSSRVSRTIATPTTPNPSKPKFQNLRTTTSNVGAIGTLPAKLIRPIPRPGAPLNIGGNLHSQPKPEESLNTSAAYKKLIDECKQRFTSEYTVPEIYKSIKEVREHNKNSLSGLGMDTIMDQIQQQLKVLRRPPSAPSKPSIAPWAQLTQGSEGGIAQGLVDWGKAPTSLRGAMDVGDDHCSICLEMLTTMPSTPLRCGHTFHVSCIKNWLNKKSDCPICRKFALDGDEFPSLTN